MVPSTSKSLWFFVTKKISGNFVTHFQFFVTLSFGVVLQAFMDQFLLTTNLATTEWTTKWRQPRKTPNKTNLQTTEQLKQWREQTT